MLRSVITVVLGCWIAAAQTSDGPIEFDAVSVKPSSKIGLRATSMQGGPGSTDPDRIDYRDMALINLVTMTFGVARRQVSGPDWLDSVRVDITASIPKGTTTAQF